MSWKLLVVFICIQTAGIRCVFLDYRLAIGWWLLLFPGSFALFLFHPFEGITASIIVVAVSANAIIWYAVAGLVNRIEEDMIVQTATIRRSAINRSVSW